MDIALVYATKTKHSQKLAHAIGERLGLTPVDISRSADPADAQALFIVGGIYGGESMPALTEYVRRLDAAKVRRAALVTSCGGGVQGQKSVRKILEEKGIAVVGEFICKGAILFVSLGHPNAGDLRAAADFAQRIVSGA